MTRTITGLFDTMEDAQAAAKELMDRGVSRDQISIVARQADGDEVREQSVGERPGAEGAGVSAVGGSVLGGALGLLVGAGLLTIPGIGPVLAIGPLAAAIGSTAAAVGAGALGAGLGAGVGGLAGSLIGAGVPEEHAESYAEGVRRGGVLLAARIDEDFAAKADEVMRRYGVADIERRGAEWRVDEEWRPDQDYVAPHADDDYALPRTDRDPSQTSRPDPSKPRVLRDHQDAGAGEAWQDSSKMGTAAGAMSGAATGAAIGAVGGPAGAVIGGAIGAAVGAGAGAAGDVAGERAVPADEYRSVNDYDQDTLSPRELAAQSQPADFSQHEGDFHTHHEITQIGGEPYERYDPAYRFGYAMATDQRYQEGGWEMFEPQLRLAWERDHPNTWEQFRPAVIFAWEKARGLR